MRTIEWESKKFGRLQILVDDEDYEKLIPYSWGVITCKSSKVKYVKARNVDLNNPRRYFSMHRFVLGVDDPKIFVDHKSGFKGVTIIRNPLSCTYRVSFVIRDGKQRRHITSKIFKTPEEAARKYNELARQYHGEFAYQNPV